MLRVDGAPDLREACTDVLDHASPVLDAGQVDRNTLELGDARRTRPGINRAIVPNGDQRHRFWAVLVDVSSLRHAGHDDERVAAVNLPLVYVAKAPIIEPGVGQLGHAAWRVVVVLRGTGQARMKQPDVERSPDSSLELGNEVLRRLGFRKADSVYDDGSLAARPFQRDRFTTPPEDLHAFRQYKFLGDP